ncbi:MAG TPA: 50S ribosomal protein L4 [Candidatus Saccharimonadales bacterium]|nr:50S ribosomal protein L4 [Candidatus Saccharimonadales bacterium]
MATKLNISLVKQAVLAAEANSRQTNSHTKTRGNVRGGGRKPWKQKGTGNARAGSRRSPIWVGGGITFGPQKERTFKQVLPKKMAKAAFNQLLNHLYEQKQLLVTDSLALTDAKTKQALTLLKKLEITGNNIVLVTSEFQPQLILACRNLPNVTVVVDKNLSILDLSKAQKIVMEKTAATTRGLLKTPSTSSGQAKPAAKAKTATKKEAA